MRALGVVARQPAAQQMAEELTQRLRRAKSHLEAAQQRAEAYENAGRRQATFEVGQQVLLNTRNLRPKQGVSRKLLPKWTGPFRVSRLIGNAAVELELPPAWRIHNVFHVSLTKPYRADGSAQPPAAIEWADGEPVYEVERLLDHREVREGRKRLTEYLVKWKGCSPEHNSWEPEAHLSDSIAKDVYWAERNGDVAARGRG